jgi:hypothetical protein
MLLELQAPNERQLALVVLVEHLPFQELWLEVP